MTSGPRLIERLKMVVGKPKWKAQKTKDGNEVAIIFREPYITRGYRLNGRSWLYYFVSLFQMHNETANVWSHLLAFIFFLFKTVQFTHSVTDWSSQPLAWGIMSFCLGTLSYSLLSAVAHLFQSRSEYHHYLFFQMDYVGIMMNAHGTGLLHYHLSGTSTFYNHFGRWYILLVTLSGFLVFLGNSFSKLYYSRPYPFTRRVWQLVPCLLAIGLGTVPLLYRLHVCFTENIPVDRGLLTHFESILWCLFSGIFFAFHIPEKLMPGVFDNVGQSHSLFHVIMTYCSVVQYSVFFEEYQSRPDELIRLASPSLVTTVGCQLALLLTAAICVILTHGVRMRKVCEDAQVCPISREYAKAKTA